MFLIWCLLIALTIQAQQAIWRYDSNSGRWFKVGDTAEKVREAIGDTTNRLKSKPTKPQRVGSHDDEVKSKSSKVTLPSKAASTQGDGSSVLLNTNALYDLALATNIGVEVSLGSDWSVGADAWLVWLRHQRTNLWWQNYGFDINGRYWFGPGHDARQHIGWHAGWYGGTFTYDVWSGKGYQSPDLFTTFRTGLEIGRSIDIGKNWRLDFYGGTGLLHTRQHVYRQNFTGGYYKVETHHRNLIDFTRFGVTVGYMLGR